MKKKKKRKKNANENCKTLWFIGWLNRARLLKTNRTCCTVHSDARISYLNWLWKPFQLWWKNRAQARILASVLFDTMSVIGGCSILHLNLKSHRKTRTDVKMRARNKRFCSMCIRRFVQTVYSKTNKTSSNVSAMKIYTQTISN